MARLAPFSRAREFMLHVDDVVCDGGSENDFTKVSTADDGKHPNGLFVSSKSALESHQILSIEGITGSQNFNLLIISTGGCKVKLIVGGGLIPRRFI